MIRKATVAGHFYPDDPEELRTFIESCIGKAEAAAPAKALLAPHAGYVYSGAVAAETFSSARIPRRVILLGPNHSGLGEALALSPAEVWEMPMGKVRTDADMNDLLRAECPGLKEDSRAHLREHSLEVQIPFLQYLRPDFRFSAICIRAIEYKALEELGRAMARVIRSSGEPVLLAVSSDMSHYESAEAAARRDKLAIDRILALDPAGLYKTVLRNNISMCGFAPAVAALTACLDLGASSGRLISYTNSGAASGDWSSVVAYAGIIID
ncbi:MAG TPA: AmmeMemoRadiSam system protein B [Acidobacteriota bacterium]|nr:AmmeMemoRadiSam system protein B [Acidobacteriota bacterium]